MATAKYYFAQYMRDPFRKEPRNVGVIVECDGEFAMVFWAETEPGKIDTRKAAKRVDYPSIYRQWIKHWRYAVAKDGIERVLRPRRSLPTNWIVVPAGRCHSSEKMDAVEIAKDVFARLVDDAPKMAAHAVMTSLVQ